MSIEAAKTEINNCVYKAACIIESLEHLGVYQGNGHHAAQDIAMLAVGRFLAGVTSENKIAVAEKKVLSDIILVIQKMIDREIKGDKHGE